MNYIDNNCDKINDPRTASGLFLSYCFEFGPRLIGPLIEEYIESGEKEQWEVDILMQLVHWLSSMGYVLFHDFTAPIPSQSLLFSESEKALLQKDNQIQAAGFIVKKPAMATI